VKAKFLNKEAELVAYNHR